MRQVQEEVERYKELVATFETSVARKDQLIASLTASLEKQVSKCYTHTHAYYYFSLSVSEISCWTAKELQYVEDTTSWWPKRGAQTYKLHFPI